MSRLSNLINDPEFIAAASHLSPDDLRIAVRHIAAGVAAASYRHSPDGADLPDVEALTNALLIEFESLRGGIESES